jgi:hypothetical protein
MMLRDLSKPNAKMRNARLMSIRKGFPSQTNDVWSLYAIKVDMLQAQLDNLDTDVELGLI